MTKTITIIIYVINSFILYRMVNAYIEGNDKAIFILMLGIPMLSVVNFIIGGNIGRKNTELKKSLNFAGTGILILWIPILFIIPMFY